MGFSQFAGGNVQSIQRGTIAVVSATSNTATINSVDTAKSIVFFGGQTSNDTDTFQGVFNARAELTNATTVTAFLGASNDTDTVTVPYQVLEFRMTRVF